MPTPKLKRDFPAFPFDPYPIQIDFMNFLYESLDKGGVAMLESPTGTGKTLSIICSALQWVSDRKKQRQPTRIKTLTTATGDDEEPDWMRDFSVESPQKKDSTRIRRLGLESKNPNRKPPPQNPKNRENRVNESREGGDEEREFIVEDYESEDERVENGMRASKRKQGLSSSEDEDDDDVADEVEAAPKVYFASRTHSQLSQFVKEFKRTTFASEFNLVSLGSRKNLCINPEVSKLGNANRINERCLELQKNRKDSKTEVQSDGAKLRRTKTSSGCPMLRKQNLRKVFKDEARERGPLDIEDLMQLGSGVGTCPYYASRDMVRAADLVVLPYQSLLLRSARESLSLNLKGNIVIIDEAHNLADSLASMYNAIISLSQLKQVISLLELYFERFRNCFGPGNRRYIQTLIVLAQSFLRLLLHNQDDDASDKNYGDVSMTINEFLFSLGIDNINLVKLHQYVKESNVINKVSGYGTKIISLQNDSIGDIRNHGAEGSVIFGFQAFVDIIVSLVNNDSDGRIIVSRQKNPSSGQAEGHLKFVMLSGGKIFSEIIGQACSVILAGGTLQPIEETRVRLFSGLSSDQVHFFTCGHIVPPESVLPIAVSCGPSGVTFDFSYNSRSSPNMIYDAWKASGVLQRILKRKHIFREPRNNTDVDIVLSGYKEAINRSNKISREDCGPHGAVLFAVVGGKVSEGINFSDGMGRCVVMVGLPYPSPSDVELMERVKHIDGLGEPISIEPSKPLNRGVYGSNTVRSGFEILKSCRKKGRDYYENLCMKAVNQSIGRAIRHINDYAAVLLVDSRYACNRLSVSSSHSTDKLSHPTDKLPQWIRSSLVSCGSYGEVHRLLHRFFQLNKKRGALCN